MCQLTTHPTPSSTSKKRTITRRFRIATIYGVHSAYQHCYTIQNVLSASRIHGKLQKSRNFTQFYSKTPIFACLGKFRLGRRRRGTIYYIHNSPTSSSRPLVSTYHVYAPFFVITTQARSPKKPNATECSTKLQLHPPIFHYSAPLVTSTYPLPCIIELGSRPSFG